MKPELRKKIIKFNRQRAKDAEAAADLGDLLSRLPPGIVKQLKKDETCSAILAKYGFTDS